MSLNKEVVLRTEIVGFVPKRGKVRDIYDFGDSLLLVSSDRISAFDWVLPTGIPDKGKILNQTSSFWFNELGVGRQVLMTDVYEMPFPAGVDLSLFAGRSMLVRKCKILPIECVVRGYLSGSGWREYCESGIVCGIKLPAGLRESERLPEPIFTPSTKAESGHDVNITFDEVVNTVGIDAANLLREKSLDIFLRGSEYALKRGIIIADTKFEFGFFGNELILADEVFTPDSSRFWSLSDYEAGKGQPSFDKQFVRDWLTSSGWDKNSPPPELPDDIVMRTREKYVEAFEILTGKKFVTDSKNSKN
ncbi:MAG: phosphoribosylaminoimidazolesuccinocarboxamide synthase [Planctomycetaceae bacterium]|jgi:phosphoribosylaminoimidazole-succinocarboxamide synthase|nr:phosphoribosylaminoimidazolesuccinocarboxamide synthase [Planctomycetaceae bacterium]